MVSPLFRGELRTGFLGYEVSERRRLAVEGSRLGVGVARDLLLGDLSKQGFPSRHSGSGEYAYRHGSAMFKGQARPGQMMNRSQSWGKSAESYQSRSATKCCHGGSDSTENQCLRLGRLGRMGSIIDSIMTCKFTIAPASVLSRRPRAY